MIRSSFQRSFGIGALLLGFGGVIFAAPPARTKAPSVPSLLRAQIALQKGREKLEKGDLQAAVTLLESELATIDGHREYLDTLRSAYEKLIQKQLGSKNYPEARRYLRRLEILQPGATDRLTASLPDSIRKTVRAPMHKPGIKFRAKGEDPKPLPQPKTNVGPLSVRQPSSGNEEPSEPKPEPKPAAPEPQKKLPEARTLVTQAEQLFVEQKYREAAKVYEEASRLAPEVVEPVKERWAFCRMTSVVDVLNSQQPDIDYASLEKEVSAALQLTTNDSRLTPYGEALLKTIAQRKQQKPAPVGGGETASVVGVKVEHVELPDSDWKAAKTANFHLYHQQDQKFAEDVAQRLEQARTEGLRRWFTKADPAWKAPCEVYLHQTAEDYHRVTRVSAQSPGHSTIKRKGSDILQRRIDLHVDLKEALTVILPHEVTHVTLAGQFGPFDLPRWADEGMALLSEPDARQQQYAALLPTYRRRGQLFRIRSLMQMRDWPSKAEDVTMFHAQSLSLVKFLVQMKGHPTFAQFLDASLSGDFELSLRRFYGVQSYDELESRWLANVFPRAGR